MKKISFYLCLLASACYSQKKNAIWCFGDSFKIIFNGQAAPIISNGELLGRGSCASIATDSGKLEFYASTMYNYLWQQGVLELGAVYSKCDTIMSNGTYLIGGGWYREMTIIPKPMSDSLYYLFCAGVTSIHGFYYSIIDMSQDSGRGAVIQKNVPLMQHAKLAQCGMQACRHANG